ncbi:hypothetical protein OIE43_09035 [Streptomyces pseudovenezuelae]|uniref:hypothetical protein n=1 Tax=Streptomyces pseudovenezuelae TaxID=67350 RepID=UPI002E365E06|nr:hypothetical protein [Streptomyces pseudovenezuelae]WUA87666.1 hypothetical protein OHO81_10375 [Streptomyces pseudovenezuelae]
MARFLGPLELVGDRWVIGDPKRGEGSCVVLTRDGMEHHVRGVPEARSAVPWSRVEVLTVKAAARTWQATRTGGVVNTLGGGYGEAGPDACVVGAYLRYPREGWTVVYGHHERPYTYQHMFLLGDLFRKTAEARAAHLLGDPEWLARVVAALAPTPRWTPLPGRRVTELLRELGVT